MSSGQVLHGAAKQAHEEKMARMSQQGENFQSQQGENFQGQQGVGGGGSAPSRGYTQTGELKGAAAQQHEAKMEREGGGQGQGSQGYVGEGGGGRSTSPGRGYNREGNLVGVAAESAKGNLQGAAKQAHEAKLVRQGGGQGQGSQGYVGGGGGGRSTSPSRGNNREGNLVGVAAESAKGNLQGAAKQAHEAKLARQGGVQGQGGGQYEQSSEEGGVGRGFNQEGNLVGAAAQSAQGKLQGAAAQAHEAKMERQGGEQSQGFVGGGGVGVRGTSPGRGFTREGDLIGAAKAQHEAKEQALQKGEEWPQTDKLQGAAKQAHEAKLQRQV